MKRSTEILRHQRLSARHVTRSTAASPTVDAASDPGTRAFCRADRSVAAGFPQNRLLKREAKRGI